MLYSVEEADTIIVFDFSNVVYTAYYAGIKSGIPCEFLCLNKMLSFIRPTVLSSGKVAVVCAVDQTPIHKKLLIPTYKENRSSVEVDPRPSMRAILENAGLYFVESKDQEADDVIASFCASFPDKKIKIISGDHDILQLLNNKNIMMFRSTTGEVFTKSDLHKKFNLVSWEKIALYKACFGDASDAIKPGLPKVRKQQILPVIHSSNGIDEFLANVNNFNLSKNTSDIINANIDNLKRIYSIVKLNTDLPLDLIAGRNDSDKLQRSLFEHQIKSITRSDYKYLLLVGTASV